MSSKPAQNTLRPASLDDWVGAHPRGSPESYRIYCLLRCSDRSMQFGIAYALVVGGERTRWLDLVLVVHIIVSLAR